MDFVPATNLDESRKDLRLADERCRFIKFADLVKADGLFGYACLGIGCD
jgi:hypothetical protein